MPHVALGGVLSLGVCEKVINHLRMKKSCLHSVECVVTRDRSITARGFQFMEVITPNVTLREKNPI